MGKNISEEIVVSDSDESMPDVSESTNGVKGEPQQNSTSVDSSDSSSGSGSESDSGRSDESEAEAENNSTNIRPSLLKKREYAFVPPAGFRQTQPKTRPSPAISSALSNLEGKQVFHITAPSSLPVSQIKEIAFGKAMLGEPILSHKGVDYGLVADTQQNQGSETLLVYDEAKNTFSKKQELRNIESYNIQEIVRLPGLGSIQASSTQGATKEKPAARPHPKHLRMRFHPVGSRTLPPETVGSSSESEAEEPTFRVPSKSLNKRRADGHDESKKSKKSKTDIPSSQGADTRRDKEKKKSSKHRDETSQERRARKEEKKKRKAEKGK